MYYIMNKTTKSHKTKKSQKTKKSHKTKKSLKSNKIQKTPKKRRTTFKKGRTPSNISKKKYLSLIKQRQNNKISLSAKENYQLDFALHRKYCNCIEQIKYKYYMKSKNKRNSVRNSANNNKNNPYGICNSSIYMKRGFIIPKKSRKCSKLYE